MRFQRTLPLTALLANLAYAQTGITSLSSISGNARPTDHSVSSFNWSALETDTRITSFDLYTTWTVSEPTGQSYESSTGANQTVMPTMPGGSGNGSLSSATVTASSTGSSALETMSSTTSNTGAAAVQTAGAWRAGMGLISGLGVAIVAL